MAVTYAKSDDVMTSCAHKVQIQIQNTNKIEVREKRSGIFLKFAMKNLTL